MKKFSEWLMEATLTSDDYYEIADTFYSEFAKKSGLKMKGKVNDVHFSVLNNQPFKGVMVDYMKGNERVVLYMDDSEKYLLGFSAETTDRKDNEGEANALFKKVETILKNYKIAINTFKCETVDGYMDDPKACVRAFNLKGKITFPDLR